MPAHTPNIQLIVRCKRPQSLPGGHAAAVNEPLMQMEMYKGWGKYLLVLL